MDHRNIISPGNTSKKADNVTQRRTKPARTIRHSLAGSSRNTTTAMNATRRRSEIPRGRDIQTPHRESFVSPHLLQTPVYNYNIQTPGRPPVSPHRLNEISQQKNPIWGFIRNSAILLIWIAFFYIMYLALYPERESDLKPKIGKPYCDTESFEQTDCQDCPQHGYCVDGKLIACEEPYRLNMVSDVAVCVEDEEISKGAMLMAQWTQNYLGEKAGNVECYGKGKREENLADIQTMLKNQTDICKDKFDSCFNKFLENIKESSEFGIQIIKINSHEALYSTNPTIPFSCHVKKNIKKNIHWIIGGGIVLILLAYFNHKRNQAAKEKRDLEDLITLVLSRLRDVKKGVPEHIRDSLKEDYGDQIDVLKLWPRVLETLDTDSRVTTRLGDENQRVWEWVATDATSPAHSVGSISRELFSSPEKRRYSITSPS